MKHIGFIRHSDPCSLRPVMDTMPFAAYQAVRRINPSTLVKGLRGTVPDPYAVKLAFESQDNERTDAMDRGSLAHLMILEPHRVSERVAIWKGKVRNGNEWDAFQETNRDKLIVRDRDYQEVQEGAMIAAGVREVREILSGCEIEPSLFWSEGSILCKGRADAISGASPFGVMRIPDIKTTNRIDESSVIRTIQSMHYRQKMAIYRRALSIIRGVPTSEIRCPLIFVKLEPPFGVNIVQLGSDGLDWAEKQMLNLIGEVERCIDSGQWSPLATQSAFGMTAWEEMNEEDTLEASE